MEITGNLRYVAGVTEYVVDGNDGTINVDTSVNSVTIILPNINNSGFANTSKGFIINDISSNASVNNIIITANRNSVNSASSVVISNNGGSAKCSVANINEWFVITEPQTGGVTLADNGLQEITVGTIELGGVLIRPTDIGADDTNIFSITDKLGTFLQTRDANGNFIFNSVYGVPSFSSSSLIFAFSSDSGTDFTNSTIAYNFGGACIYDTAVDTYNFGDYSTFRSTSITFNLGRGNTYDNTVGISVFGNYNSIDTCNNITIIGSNNVVNAETDIFILGNYNYNLVVDSLGNIGNTLTMTSKLHITDLLEFTDNADALANSLTAGAFYRTGDIVKVVH
jgi:hypothetical protein